MSILLHIKDIALLKTLREDSAQRWTVADIEALFRTAEGFEASLTPLQQRDFVFAWQVRGAGGRLRWQFTLNPLKSREARRTVEGADQVALAEQLTVLGREAAMCELVR
ncbi:hypothetical protein C8D87_114181 [Lentzea atacamensis]|uniref:Transcriptional regulator n=1 Tax=Lentzea atacamensis TaxID=531938 RepID=A0ABX9DYQ8_9PSEU|nr:hypothetical protein [Lentzea atacamensis]RAS59569.1 hypothetical protein C8D87_114181 [Lentzea atacamensis]